MVEKWNSTCHQTIDRYKTKRLVFLAKEMKPCNFFFLKKKSSQRNISMNPKKLIDNREDLAL
jgi:hypothetical protein